MNLDTATLRRLSVEYQVDPRSIRREHDCPGSVRGMAGHRARAAVAALQTSAAPPTHPANAAVAAEGQR
jgi:hypothetical protein